VTADHVPRPVRWVPGWIGSTVPQVRRPEPGADPPWPPRRGPEL